MNKNITPATRTKSPACRQVQIKAFNVNGRDWKDSYLSWLREMRNLKFGLTEIHTLYIQSGYRSNRYRAEIFIIPVVGQPWLGPWGGHNIFISCDSPPVTTIYRHAWRWEGKTPHFESHVQPLIDKLVAGFEGRQSWAD
ncbi:MAG: hypothetical protein O7B35_18820 [Deltaproteobacteria bacterium]|nr:hypothetical protein [Deltaproteobacteria bacterium]